MYATQNRNTNPGCPRSRLGYVKWINIIKPCSLVIIGLAMYYLILHSALLRVITLVKLKPIMFIQFQSRLVQSILIIVAPLTTILPLHWKFKL